MLMYYNEAMKEISAGAILYTYINNDVYYLLIKDFHNNWGFPKGHLESNETPLEAAKREIKEEVGINAQILDSFNEELVYIMPNGVEKHSVYYIGTYLNQTPNKQLEEVQEIRLLKYDDALKLLTFDNMKELLNKANTSIKALK